MSEINHSDRVGKSHSKWALCVLAAALMTTGCATTTPEPEVTADDLASVEERLRDVERTNGRLMVRVEETERQVARARDRAESNRIAIQRQRQLGQERMATSIPTGGEQGDHQRPQPAPESNYRHGQESQGYRADPTLEQRMDQRGGARIPLSDQQSGRVSEKSPGHAHEPTHEQASSADDSPTIDDDQEEIVITNEDLEARFGPSPSSSSGESSSTASSSSQSSGSSSAHPPVTSERLPTTDELEFPPEAAESPSEEEAPSQKPPARESSTETAQSSGDEYTDASHEELMELYQDSLADYRAGDYATALQGFSTFLDAGPRQDYVDNALYWIGECHYGLGEFETSVEHFQRIIDELPQANKVPDAMLKMSLAYEQMGQTDQAVELLEELTDDYPNTNPARLGEERLEEFSQ